MAPSTERSLWGWARARARARARPCSESRADRRTRKPLVEKKRRARINESLRELRALLADSELQAKLENAEVLERTVRRVRAVLQRRGRGGGRRLLEASERFAAGYIQCMHEVHTFVSGCPGIDAGTAAALLNHLLQAMPLRSARRPRSRTDPRGQHSQPQPQPRGAARPGPAQHTGFEADEAEAEPEAEPGHTAQALPKAMWRPW